MKVRVLDPEEWARLQAEQHAPSMPFVDPGGMEVIVVENEVGDVVACLSVLTVTHLEGLWIAPEHRGRGGVLRALLRAGGELASGEAWVMGAHADGDEAMRGYLERLGGIPMPVRFCAMNPRMLETLAEQEEREACLQQ